MIISRLSIVFLLLVFCFSSGWLRQSHISLAPVNTTRANHYYSETKSTLCHLFRFSFFTGFFFSIPILQWMWIIVAQLILSIFFFFSNKKSRRRRDKSKMRKKNAGIEWKRFSMLCRKRVECSSWNDKNKKSNNSFTVNWRSFLYAFNITFFFRLLSSISISFTAVSDNIVLLVAFIPLRLLFFFSSSSIARAFQSSHFCRFGYFCWFREIFLSSSLWCFSINLRNLCTHLKLVWISCTHTDWNW